MEKRKRLLSDDPDYIALKRSLQTMSEQRLEAFKVMIREKLDKEDFQPDFLEPKEVAKLLGVGVATVRLWLRKGEMVGKKVGVRKWFVPVTELRRFF